MRTFSPWWLRCLSFVWMLSIAPAMGQPAQESQGAPDTAWMQPEYDLVRMPDPLRPDLLADSIRNILTFGSGDLRSWLEYGQRRMPERVFSAEKVYPPASPKAARQTWVIWTIGLLVLLLGLVRFAFPGEFLALVRSYYDTMFYNQMSKEEHFFGSWPLVFLYVLAGFSTGIFIYLNLSGGILGDFQDDGPRTFLLISVFLMLFFTLKVGCTHLIGFMFDVRKLTKPYTALIALAYYNMALLLLPFAFIASLLPYRHLAWLAPLAVLPVLSVLIYRGVSMVMDLFYNYRFPKFYLFVYLCTLEIAPVLILIKVLFR